MDTAAKPLVDETAAAISLAVSAGGAIKAITTTRPLSGKPYVSALKKAPKLIPNYSPMK